MPIGELPCQVHDHPAAICLTWRGPDMPVPNYFYGCKEAVLEFITKLPSGTKWSRHVLGTPVDDSFHGTAQFTTAAAIRKAVKAILDRHGYTNTFSVKRVDFEDLARCSAFFVKLQDWTPDPFFDVLKTEIKAKTGAILQGGD